MECPECGSSLYAATYSAWVCSACGHHEAVTMDNGSPWATLKRFFEIEKRDARAALAYLEWSHFAERDNLNRHYLAARLALGLGEVTTAKHHLERCLEAKAQAKKPEKLDALVRRYEHLTQTLLSSRSGPMGDDYCELS